MTTKAGEQPTITQALADDLEAAFKRHSMASSYDIQARVYEVANICLQNRKEMLNALRTTSLAAQDMVKQWEDEWTATHDDHWGDQIAWATAREIARRIDEARPTSSLAAQDGLVDALEKLLTAGVPRIWKSYRGDYCVSMMQQEFFGDTIPEAIRAALASIEVKS